MPPIHACSRSASSDILYRSTHIHTYCTVVAHIKKCKHRAKDPGGRRTFICYSMPALLMHLQIYFIGGLIFWNLQTGFLKEPTPSTMIHRARHKMHRNGEKSLLNATNCNKSSGVSDPRKLMIAQNEN